MKTIAKQVLASLLVTVLVVLGGWGYLELRNAMRLEQAGLLREQRNIVERLAFSLVYPLWNLNLQETEKAIHNEAVEENVLAILVYDESGAFYAGTIREGTSEEDIRAYNAGSSLHRQMLSKDNYVASRDIIKKGEVIGKVVLYVNDDHLRENIRHQGIAIAFKLLGLLAALSCVQFLVLRKVVIRPLTSLKGWVLSLGPEQPPPAPLKSHSEEIDILAASFSEMAEKLTRSKEEQEKNLHLLRSIMDNSFQLQGLLSPDGKLIDVNATALQMIGATRESVHGLYFWETPWWNHDPDLSEKVRQAVAGAATGEFIRFEATHVDASGKSYSIDFSIKPVRDDTGNIIYLIPEGRDITELKQAEVAHERLSVAIEQAGEVVVVTDAKGTIQYVNPMFETLTGYTRAEAIGQNPRILKSSSHDEEFYRELWDTITSGRTWQGKIVNLKKDGTPYIEEATISPVHDNEGRIVNFVAVKRDITEHLRSAEENARLETQLQQLRKMESIGQLAGGVAHDFNNMLTVILAHAEMGISKVDPSQKLFTHLEQIRNAATRSADLTRQLLAFARKQAIAPRVLDLNETLEGMLKMLRRLIGEDIQLSWQPKAELWPVNVDPSQIDQILVNLCVNARDALAGAGKLTIETGNSTIDKSYSLTHADVLPGDYVRFSVSDNGCGMDNETLAHIFEPFFTTKVIGEGTGLGLATVYGIVKQNNGFINVYSEPGQGTTFTIYLPRHLKLGEQPRSEETEVPAMGGHETILLVEDEPTILEITTEMLEELGYTVLKAHLPDEAMRQVKEHAGDIHLLITDVIMPEMDGRKLSQSLQCLSPDLKCLFMSGYTSDVIADKGVLNEGVHFIQKPFSMRDLATKVREVLDGS
jgi:two-component system cell cycle sensor histidine kinase/response regulator CckA